MPQKFKEITNEGQISAEVKINFDHNGKIVDDYKIKADLFDFDAHLLKKFNLKKIQAEIELIRNYYQIYLTQGNINGINVANSEFRISKEDKNFNVEGNLFSKAENLNYLQKQETIGKRVTYILQRVSDCAYRFKISLWRIVEK